MCQEFMSNVAYDNINNHININNTIKTSKNATKEKTRKYAGDIRRKQLCDTSTSKSSICLMRAVIANK